MIKFLYVVTLGITSFLLFIFSKEKESTVCNTQSSGIVSLITDSTGSYVGVITDQDIILHPSSMNENIILAVGQKVSICYNIDSSQQRSDLTSLPVYIQSVQYLSE